MQRFHTNSRMSQIVIHNGVVSLAGQVAKGAESQPVAVQTRTILNMIDGFLREAGTDKSKLISATIWLTDVSTFDEMNEVWDAWVAPGHAPVRACVQSALADPAYTVEIMVTAAKD